MFSKFKKQKDNQVLFIGDELIIFIPKRYKNYGCLNEGNIIETMAIFDMIVDGKQGVYCAPVIIKMVPSEIMDQTIDGKDYLKCVFHKGDIFMQSCITFKNPNLPYVVFYEFIYLANYPRFMSYDKLGSLFDSVTELTGLDFKTDHSVLELFPSQLARDPENVSLLYRLTPQKKDPLFVSLRDVPHSALSTTSKIFGSFTMGGIQSALQTDEPPSSDIETVLRK